MTVEECVFRVLNANSFYTDGSGACAVAHGAYGTHIKFSDWCTKNYLLPYTGEPNAMGKRKYNPEALLTYFTTCEALKAMRSF